MPASPLIEALLRRAGRGVGQINARTGAQASALQPFAGRAAANYGQVQGYESALGGAVSNSLTQQGQQLGADISGKLGANQAPGQAVQQFGAGTAATGAQAGAAVGALSSAEVGRLRGMATAEEIYMGALPRLAQLAGEQERRGFMAQAAEELADLAAREAEQQQQFAREDRELAYRQRQDLLDRRRQQRLDRQAFGQTRYERRQDTIDRKRQTQLDQLAQQAAAAEYGIDAARLGISQGHLATSRGNLAERQREARERERIARQREARMAAGKGSKSDRTGYFYDTREDAVKAAKELAKPTENTFGRKVRLPRSEAYQRLWTEFGTLLVGRGYRRAAVEQMLKRALAAAGY